MREVTVTNNYKVYGFNELEEDAKEKVKQWYLDGQNENFFTEMVLDDLQHNRGFKNSELEVEYSLAYCQGDGFNIYGKLILGEILEQIKENLDDEEYNWLELKLKAYESIFEMPYNRWYSFCICDRHDYTENFIDDLQYWECEDEINWDVIDKFNKECRKYFTVLCKEYEEWGYDYFYEIEDEYLAEYCEDNGFEFLEDGTLFC